MKLAPLVALLGTLLLASCYTSETVVLAPADGVRMSGVSEGVYCHAENRLLPPQVAVAPQISDALGENRCRDLRWDEATDAYRDERSSSMIFRLADIGVPGLMLLQTQTGPTAKARLAPVAVTDGMFMVFDPAGAWPEDLVAEAGLSLDAEGVLVAAEPERIRALLVPIWQRVLDQMRGDVAFVEDAAGPRLEFRRVDTAYSYIVYFREDWSRDTDRMRGAMLALTEALALGRHQATWTEQPAE
jgi:hypothetical protein